MSKSRQSRRDILKAAVALPLVYATPLRAAPPPAETVTPALIAAATKEGQLTWYTSADLQLAEKVGKAFEQKFTGIRVRVERAGGERIFSRVAQENASGCMLPMRSVPATPRNFWCGRDRNCLCPACPRTLRDTFRPSIAIPMGCMRRSALHCA